MKLLNELASFPGNSVSYRKKGQQSGQESVFLELLYSFLNSFQVIENKVFSVLKSFCLKKSEINGSPEVVHQKI